MKDNDRPSYLGNQPTTRTERPSAPLAPTVYWKPEK